MGSDFEEIPFFDLYDFPDTDEKIASEIKKTRNSKVPDRAEESRRRIMNKLDTDCVVLIGLDEYRCHTSVLTFYSELFKQLSHKGKIRLLPERCSADLFDLIYNWMISPNTCYRIIDHDNILDVYVASKYLKIIDLEKQCDLFFNSPKAFNEHSAIKLFVEAKRRGFAEIKDLMLPRIKQAFMPFVASEEWDTLNLEEVKKLLTSNEIVVNCEMDVYGSAMKWLLAAWDERWPTREELFKCVRFDKLTPPELHDIENCKHEQCSEVANDPLISKLIKEAWGTIAADLWYQGNSETSVNTANIFTTSEERNWTHGRQVPRHFLDFLRALVQYQ